MSVLTSWSDRAVTGLVIVNEDAFSKRNLEKAGNEANPLEDGSLSEFRVHRIPMTSLTVRAVEDVEDASTRDAGRAKNLFALALLSWLYGRPADVTHQYGHGKAEHLSALAEGAILVVASGLIVWRAIVRLVDGGTSVQARWYALLVVGIVICIDLARTTASWRAARAYSSPALASNALHFGSDLAGTLAVLAGLLAVRAGWPAG